MSDTPHGLPDRIVVDENGAYWRDYGTHYSMCVVSEDNDPVVPVAEYVRFRPSPIRRRVSGVVETDNDTTSFDEDTHTHGWTNTPDGERQGFPRSCDECGEWEE